MAVKKKKAKTKNKKPKLIMHVASLFIKVQPNSSNSTATAKKYD